MNIDWNYLNQVCDSDASFQEELLSAFFTSGAEVLARLDAAIDSKDWSSIKLESHTLKGSSRSIGAFPFGEIAQCIEQAAQREEIDSDSITRLKICFEAMWSEVEQCRNAA